MINNRLSFTGNRHAPKTTELMWRLHQNIELYIEKGVTEFSCGCCYGSDFYFMSSINKHKEKYPNIKLIGYIPHLNQSEKWSQENKLEYDRLIKTCDKIIQVSNEPYTNQCMLFRNLRLVENCDYLLALFDGNSKSGTQQTINLAIKNDKVKEIMVIRY